MALTKEVSDELTKFIAQKFSELPDFNDDVKEISEYIVLLIANGRSAEETYNEVQDLVSSDGLKDLIVSTFKALDDYKNSQGQQQEQQVQQAQPIQQLPIPISSNSESSQSPQVNNSDLIISDDQLKSIPSKPAGYVSRRDFQRGGNAISKARGNGLNKNFALRNQDAFQKALNLSDANGVNTFVNSRGQIKTKSRCQKFPHCPDKNCIYSHPTKPCFQYPNCPNAPGTCTYLHIPGEDDALYAEYEKVKKEFQEQKQAKYAQFAQNKAGLVLCKFGIVCTNQQCPFGHPTPSNEDQKVTTLEWCSDNLNCSNPTCAKAHASLSKIKDIKSTSNPSISASTNTLEKSLDACKFGVNCTNRHCKFRHASTPVLCRDGENCIRIDCFFSHPINEVCRFGEACKNAKCLFQHPNGKISTGIPAKSLTWTKTNERQFAVPDNQVLEQAPPQEG